MKVALDKVIKVGVKIDAMFENIMKQGKYVDISRRGGEMEVVNRMIRNMMYNDNNKPEYDEVVSQILKLGVFKINVMVWDGEKDPKLINLLGEGVL